MKTGIEMLSVEMAQTNTAPKAISLRGGHCQRCKNALRTVSHPEGVSAAQTTIAPKADGLRGGVFYWGTCARAHAHQQRPGNSAHITMTAAVPQVVAMTVVMNIGG